MTHLVQSATSQKKRVPLRKCATEDERELKCEVGQKVAGSGCVGRPHLDVPELTPLSQWCGCRGGVWVLLGLDCCGRGPASPSGDWRAAVAVEQGQDAELPDQRQHLIVPVAQHRLHLLQGRAPAGSPWPGGWGTPHWGGGMC